MNNAGEPPQRIISRHNTSSPETATERTCLLHTIERLGPTTVGGNELRSIQGTNLDDVIPSWLDDRVWVRVPALAWHTISSEEGFIALRRKVKRTLGNSYLNVTLPLVPLAIISAVKNWDVKTVFALNLPALLALSNLLSLLTEKLVQPLGQWASSMVGRSLPHTFPLMIGIIAINAAEIELVQTFVVGSILSNILLGLGGAFIAKGIRRTEHPSSSSISNVAVVELGLLYMLLIPLATCPPLYAAANERFQDKQELVIWFSRSSSIILLFFYFLWQLIASQVYHRSWEFDRPVHNGHDDHFDPYAHRTCRPLYPLLIATTLVATLICMGYCSWHTIHSIDGVTRSSGITRHFISFILLPVFINIPHYATIYLIAYNPRSGQDAEVAGMDLAVKLTLASGVDVAVLDLPLLIIYGWITNAPMSIGVDSVESILIMLCLLLVGSFLPKGQGNHFTGVYFLGLYAIIFTLYILYPDEVDRRPYINAE